MVLVGRDLKDNPVSTPRSNNVFYFPAENLNCQTETQGVQGGSQAHTTGHEQKGTQATEGYDDTRRKNYPTSIYRVRRLLYLEKKF